MIVFDVTVKKHPEALPPDFSEKYKKAETIKAKEKEWEDEGGWKSDPASCVISSFLIADPDNPEKDIELPATENSVIQFTEHIVSLNGERRIQVEAEGTVDPVVVADDITHKTCLLANTINSLITTLEQAEDQKEDDEAVLVDLRKALAELYEFKLTYIQHNYVHGSCHNLAKTLKWDALPGTVARKMLGLSEDATRLAVLRTMALRCGLK